MTYSSKLMQIKDSFHLTEAQFSTILNVSTYELENWLNGTQKPSKENLLQFENVFGVSSSILFKDDKKCSIKTMKIKLNKQFQLMNAMNTYFNSWKACALSKKKNLYILNPILNIFYFVISPFQTIGDIVIDKSIDNFKEKRNHIDYLNYLLEYNEAGILLSYKKGYAIAQILPYIPTKRKFKFNGNIYRKKGYIS